MRENGMGGVPSVSFHVDVVSPEAVVWSGEADFLVARTVEGEIGILTGHEPLMAALATGAVVIESGSETTTIGVHGGFLQVLDDQVTLLTDRAQVAVTRDAARDVAEDLRTDEGEDEAAEPGRAAEGPGSSAAQAGGETLDAAGEV
ncbi:MAG: F0F1 ATP synthase subunit epsilon [Acidimicrobiia bacterium]